jgi:signal transduction histidine kinase
MAAKLTFTYAGITFAFFIILVGVLMIWAMSVMSSPLIFTTFLRSSADTYAPTLAPMLSSTPPDRDGVGVWLDAVGFTDQHFPISLASTNTFQNPEKAFLSAAVFDARGALIGARGPYSAGIAVGAEALSDPISKETRTEDGHQMILVTSLIRSTSGVVGVLALRQDLLDDMYFAFDNWNVLPVLGLAAVFTLVSGLVSGFITAYWLSRRIKILRTRAAAWAKGELPTTTPSRPRRKPDELGELSDRLDEMAARISALMKQREKSAAEAAAGEERARIARDLHDSVKQETFAAVMRLAAARDLLEKNPSAACASLDEALRLLDASRAELELLIRGLRPDPSGAGLAIGLHGLVSAWAARNGIKTSLGCAQGVDVEGNAGLELLLVAREALANVEKHAGARNASVRLERRDGDLILSVDDDGSGMPEKAMDASGRPEGFGLTSMRERVEALGGRLEIGTSGLGGTRIEARLPGGLKGGS